VAKVRPDLVDTEHAGIVAKWGVIFCSCKHLKSGRKLLKILISTV